MHPVWKQVYKLELLKKWRIHDVFHISLLEQDTTKKKRMDNNAATHLEFKADENEEYDVEWIQDSEVYAKESKAGHLPGLYYLVLWKSYPKEENTWESALAVEYLWKLLSNFHQKNPNKLTATSPPVNSAPPMAKPTVKPTGATKQKRGRAANNGANKKAKKTRASAFFHQF